MSYGAELATRQRNCIERLASQLKRYDRVATEHEKRTAPYIGVLTLAAALLSL